MPFELLEPERPEFNKQYAPETAIGTGALEPIGDEQKAAELTPSVDENTVGNGAQNQPAAARSIDYSGEPTAEPTTGEDEKSTGEDFETRNADDETLAGANVSPDDAEVNKPAAEVRPEEPQAPKRVRKAKDEQ